MCKTAGALHVISYIIFAVYLYFHMYMLYVYFIQLENKSLLTESLLCWNESLISNSIFPVYTF